MKIAILTRFAHRVGGIESYVECVVPAVERAGHDVVVWHEFDVPSGERSFLPERTRRARLGPSPQAVTSGLAELAAWKPDVIFSQGIAATAAERQSQSIAPLVVLLHAYDGTCISGSKMHDFPSAQPCARELGPGCLLRYHVRRCGGWSPVTMVTRYADQRVRQAILREATVVATLSEHMRLEAVAQGVAADRAVHLPAFVPRTVEHASIDAPAPAPIARPIHLLFVGRMEHLKGGELLLDALEQLTTARKREVSLTFVGDGRRRPDLERRAERLRSDGVDVRFAGWLEATACAAVMRTADLLVVPSIWPEPLGLVGLEAAAESVPAVAFDIGGIGDWLHDGVTGRLIRGPASSAKLKRALDDCVADRSRLKQWGRNAAEAARKRTIDAHVSALLDVLCRACGRTAIDSASRTLTTCG
jgi:glycosyltransferase involved in cell wall biosynthesis